MFTCSSYERGSPVVSKQSCSSKECEPTKCEKSFGSSWLSALNVPTVFVSSAIRTSDKRPSHFADNPLFFRKEYLFYNHTPPNLPVWGGMMLTCSSYERGSPVVLKQSCNSMECEPTMYEKSFCYFFFRKSNCTTPTMFCLLFLFSKEKVTSQHQTNPRQSSILLLLEAAGNRLYRYVLQNQ